MSKGTWGAPLLGLMILQATTVLAAETEVRFEGKGALGEPCEVTYRYDEKGRITGFGATGYGEIWEIITQRNGGYEPGSRIGHISTKDNTDNSEPFMKARFYEAYQPRQDYGVLFQNTQVRGAWSAEGIYDNFRFDVYGDLAQPRAVQWSREFKLIANLLPMASTKLSCEGLVPASS